MPTPDGKGYLLLVEDEHNLARYLQLELENEGFSTDIEYDGLSGLEKALTISTISSSWMSCCPNYRG